MANDIQQFPTSEFPTIYCTKLVINPSTTRLKWSTYKKHPGITILGSIDIAKSISTGEEGIIASIGSLIGTDTYMWHYTIHAYGDLHVGMAESTQDMKRVDNVAFGHLIKASTSDRIQFVLSTMATLTIKHMSSGGTIYSIEVFDISNNIGKTLYPWISSSVSSTLSVKIYETTPDFAMTVQPDGKIVMSTSNNNIVDLNIGDIVENSGINSVDIASDRIQNTTSGNSIVAKNDGGLLHTGGTRYICSKITSAVINVALSLNQYSIVINNSDTTGVTLPPVNDVDECMEYTISRDYNIQAGETWQNPALKLYGNGTDTIDGESWIGLPPETSITVMSIGSNQWRIK